MATDLQLLKKATRELGEDDPIVVYSKAIIRKEIPSNKKIKIAIRRNLRELVESIENPDYPFEYNPEIAGKLLKFASLLTDVSTGTPFKPAKFQAYILAQSLGWRTKKTGGVRYKDIFVSMARTNGKTQLMSAYTLFNFLFGQPVQSRQMAISSIDMGHTSQLYGYITSNWARLAEEELAPVQRELQVEFNRNEFRIETQNTVLKRLSAQASPSDSYHFTTSVVDEYHLFGQKEEAFISSITSGQVQNPHAQNFFISTAGVDPSAPMFGDYKRYAKAFEADDFTGLERTLILIWEQDYTAEVDKPEAWIKSNPLMELESMHKNLVDGMTAEKNKLLQKGKISDFLVKNLNLWQNAKVNNFLTLENITKAQVDEAPIDITGRDVFIGYDASQKEDDSALVFNFPYIAEDGAQAYYIKQHSWVPLSNTTLDEKSGRDNINYKHSEEMGYATVSRDRFGEIDDDDIFNYLMEFIEENRLNVQFILYDPWKNNKFIKRLEGVADYIPILPVKQTITQLNEPTKFLSSLFTKGNIQIDKQDELFQIALINAVTYGNVQGIKIDKNTNTQKIDAVDALVNTLYEAMYYFTNLSNVKRDELRITNKQPFGSSASDEDINSYFVNDFSF